MVDELVPWVDKNLATSNSEQNWLIGFSSWYGGGGEDLLLRNPGVFTVAASWDFPADMTSYNQFGTSPQTAYGTNENYLDNYDLTQAFVNKYKGPFLTQNRIWLGGYYYYSYDVNDYESLGTSAGVAFTAEPMTQVQHRWDSGWVPAAMAALYQDSLSCSPAPRDHLSGHRSRDS